MFSNEHSCLNNKWENRHKTNVWSILLLWRLVSLTVLSIEQLNIVASDVRLWNAKSRIGFEWMDTNSDVLKSSVLIWNSVKTPISNNNLIVGSVLSTGSGSCLQDIRQHSFLAVLGPRLPQKSLPTSLNNIYIVSNVAFLVFFRDLDSFCL